MSGLSLLDMLNGKIEKPTIMVSAGTVDGRTECSDSSEEDEEPMDNGIQYADEYKRREFVMYQDEMLNHARTGTMSCMEDTTSLREEAMEIIDNVDTTARIYQEYPFDINCRTQTMTIDAHKARILNSINSVKVMIISGPTGCGKTTQVPQYILDDCREKNLFCKIVVTQPRKIAAISVARRVCNERGWEVGQSVCGYQVGLEKQVMSNTLLTYVTTGVLLQQIIKKQNLNEFTHILIDEVHERNQDMDFLLLLIRRFLNTNSPTTKVILMSATFNIEKFGHYFRSYTMEVEIPAIHVSVTKDNKYITSIYYLEQFETDRTFENLDCSAPRLDKDIYPTFAKLVNVFDRLDQRDLSTNKVKIGNVLVFLPGIYEIEEAYTILMKQEKSKDWLILPLHSSITNAEQSRVFVPPPEGVRKIILSTNIAESSITVPDIEYIIDFCLTKSLVVDPFTQHQCLKLEWASHTNCIQRAGRVGRVSDGRVYRMITRNFYERYMDKDVVPEMLRAPLDRIVLSTKILEQVEPPKAILALAIDPPTMSNIEMTTLNLKEIGALLPTCRGMIIKTDGDITFLGKIMSLLPLDVRLSKLICLGYIFCCLEESIIMATASALSNIFATPFQERLRSYSNRLMWADGSCSDLIAHLNLYKVWKSKHGQGAFSNIKVEQEWCKNHYLSYRAMKEWDILVSEIKCRLEHLGLMQVGGQSAVKLSQNELPLMLKVIICGAFYPNYFKRQGNHDADTERDAVRLINGLNPYQTVYFTNMDNNQPGPLYTQRIKKILKPCMSEKETLNVYFDSGAQKVFVSFAQSSLDSQTIKLEGQTFVTTMPGKISSSIYKAVKMRQLKHTQEIPVLCTDKAWDRAKELGIATNDSGTNKIIIPKVTKRHTILPSLNESAMRIIITEVIDVSNFYAQPLDEQTSYNLNILHDALNNVPLRNAELPIKNGKVYATLFQEDNLFYRCKVLAIMPLKNDICVQIQFIDYGNITSVSPNVLRELPMGPATILPSQAFECILTGIRPSQVYNTRGLWTSDNIKLFMEMTKGVHLNAKIYSVVNNVVSVELYKSSNVSLNEWFIKQGYADAAEESYLSKENHIRRMESQQYSHNSNAADYEEIHDLAPAVEVEAPSESECRSTITLKGPISPLEMMIHNYNDSIRTVRIDHSSVNAVLLDSNPQDPNDQLLVATYVSKQANTDALTLRHTTLMPTIKGFPALMAMLFCPKLTPKPNKDGSFFASILCGLGTNTDGKAMYPAHDLIIPIDAEINVDDFNKVNEIRYWLNKTVASMVMIHEKQLPSNDVETCQRELKERIFNLLKRKRNHQAKEFVKHEKSWNINMYDFNIMCPGPTKMSGEIWALHWIYELKEQSTEHLATRRHLKELSDTAKNIIPMTTFKCKLCDVNFLDIHELRSHLISDSHKEVVKLNESL